jgi:large subunit ribosomal protein L25
MDIRELTVTTRRAVGKEAARRIRREGRLPAVLYGGAAPIAVSLNPKDVQKVLHGHGGGNVLLNVRFDDQPGDPRPALIRALQFDPVTERLVHLDLQEISMDREITVRVPIHAGGEAAGVKEQGGILALILREVEVACLPHLIPDRIDVEVNALRIGDVLTVGDLTPPTGVRLLGDAGQAVVTVAPPTVEEVAAPPAAAVPSEPEVISEKKAEAREKEEKKEE